MRILFISRQVPNPNGTGVDRRAAQHLAGLRRLGEVTMVVPPLALKDAREQGLDLATIDVERLIARTEPSVADRSVARWREARNPLSRRWHQLRMRHSQDQRALPADVAHYRREIGDGYDLLFAFRLASGVWIESVLDAAARPPVAVLDIDDIESVAHARITAAAPRPTRLGRWREGMFGRWLRSTERRLIGRWDATLVCSEHDRAALERETGAEILVVPNSVPFAPPAPQPAGAVNILFVGTMSYAPNVTGIGWFVDLVWPRVRAELGPEATLTVAGANPKPEVLELAAVPGVEVLGRVDDLAPVYARATLVIAPIFAGGGTRIKLLEAMAHGRAAVTTSLGCEGLNLTAREAEIADTADAFAAAVVRLATDVDHRRRLAAAAWTFGAENYAAEAVTDRFVADLRRLLARRIPARFASSDAETPSRG